MIKKLGVFKDFSDNSLKTVLEIKKNQIIEMTLITNKEDTDVVSVPTHYFCDIKCKNCKLGSCHNETMKKIDLKDFIESLICSVTNQNNDNRRTNNSKLQILFDGGGDALLNLNLIEKIYLNEKYIKDKLGYKKIDYVISTILPIENIDALIKITNELSIPIKIEFIVNNTKEIEKKLQSLKKYQLAIKDKNNNKLIELVHPLTNNSKETLFNLCEIIKDYDFAIKLINFNNETKTDNEYQLLIDTIIKKYPNLKITLQSLEGMDVRSTCKNLQKNCYYNEQISKEDERNFELWKIKHQIHEQQRSDNLKWDEYFMAIAKLTALRSKDPNTQVGACIVGKDNRILSIGYNGSPNGYNDECFIWQREGKPLDTKYLYVVHAERNAILNYRGSRRDFENAKIYVDLFPCNECAKEIIQAGIKEVIYLSDKYADLDITIASKKLFDACGVSYRQLKQPKNKKITIDLNIEK